MKTWTEAEIRELEINETAFGPHDKTRVDSEQYAVHDDAGNVIGYRTEFGESGESELLMDKQ